MQSIRITKPRADLEELIASFNRKLERAGSGARLSVKRIERAGGAIVNTHVSLSSAGRSHKLSLGDDRHATVLEAVRHLARSAGVSVPIEG